MATARAQAISGSGIHVRGERGPDGKEIGYTRLLSEEDDEFPLTWLKRIVARAIWTQRFFWLVAGLLVALDLFLTVLVILAVDYTEIDFSTYMQQADLFMKGQRVYHLIKGDTGPCVYPALHLYISSALSWISKQGQAIRPAQLTYMVLYICTEISVMGTYNAAQIPPALLPLLILSRRLHSIYVLRLFNDCWAMAFFYASAWLMCNSKWRLASVLYSLALGVKMNILLYAPAMCAIYYRALGLRGSIIEALVVLTVQVILGLPFLMQDPTSYIFSAFNLSREFLYKWTVNLRFLEEETFLDKKLAYTLLAGHFLLISFWATTKWTGLSKEGLAWVKAKVKGESGSKGEREPSGRFIATSLFTSNLIGISFSRSLHYQFYSWYAQQIPLMIYVARLPNIVRFPLSLIIERVWNIYPSTPNSSLILLGCHLTLLLGLYASTADEATADENRRDEKEVAKELAIKYARKTRAI